MWVSELTKENLTNDVIDRLLFEGLNDDGMSVDCIIVLGSIKAAKYRVPAAVKALSLTKAATGYASGEKELKARGKVDKKRPPR